MFACSAMNVWWCRSYTEWDKLLMLNEVRDGSWGSCLLLARWSVVDTIMLDVHGDKLYVNMECF
jgi:hypothetical protein